MSVGSDPTVYVEPAYRFVPFEVKGVLNPDDWFKTTRGIKSDKQIRRENRLAIYCDLIQLAERSVLAKDPQACVLVEVTGAMCSDGRGVYIKLKGQDGQYHRYSFRIVTVVKQLGPDNFIGRINSGELREFKVSYENGYGYTGVKVSSVN